MVVRPMQHNATKKLLR